MIGKPKLLFSYIMYSVKLIIGMYMSCKKKNLHDYSFLDYNIWVQNQNEELHAANNLYLSRYIVIHISTLSSENRINWYIITSFIFCSKSFIITTSILVFKLCDNGYFPDGGGINTTVGLYSLMIVIAPGIHCYFKVQLLKHEQAQRYIVLYLPFFLLKKEAIQYLEQQNGYYIIDGMIQIRNGSTGLNRSVYSVTKRWRMTLLYHK